MLTLKWSLVNDTNLKPLDRPIYLKLVDVSKNDRRSIC